MNKEQDEKYLSNLRHKYYKPIIAALLLLAPTIYSILQIVDLFDKVVNKIEPRNLTVSVESLSAGFSFFLYSIVGLTFFFGFTLGAVCAGRKVLSVFDRLKDRK